MLGTLHVIWKTLDGQRLRYGAAVAALVVASCFLYLAPLVLQAVLDGVIVTDGEPSLATRVVVDLLGGATYLSDNLWLPGLVFVALTALAGGFTYLRGRHSA